MNVETEVTMEEVHKTYVNWESTKGVAGGALLVFVGLMTAQATGGISIELPEGIKGLLPAMILIAVLAISILLISGAKMYSHTVELVPIRRPKNPLAAMRSNLDEAPLDAEIKDAASEQPTSRGENSKPVAATPVAPKPDQKSDQGDERRTDGSSDDAPREKDAGKPGHKPWHQRDKEDA